MGGLLAQIIMKSFKCVFRDGKVIVNDSKSISALIQKGYGTKDDKILELSLVEGLYLMEKDKVQLEFEGKLINFSEFIDNLIEGEFLQYKVYKDLRERGYTVKTGFKFGAHFRIYERGAFSKGEHSIELVHVLNENSSFDMHEVAGAVRLAQSVKKTLILAVVDNEGDITYYRIERITP